MTAWCRLFGFPAALALTAMSAAAQPLPFSYWVPDATTVTQIENFIEPVNGPYRLEDYDRYYTGITAGRKTVSVLFVKLPPGTKPTVHRVDRKHMPSGDPRNCGLRVVDLDKPNGQRAVLSHCERATVTVLLSQQPYWAPDEAAIRAMEDGILLSAPSRFRPMPLERYTRYYTGATRDGRRVIAGKLLATRPVLREIPGIRIVDQAEFERHIVFDGGCGVIETVYDVEAKNFLYRQCNGPS